MLMDFRKNGIYGPGTERKGPPGNRHRQVLHDCQHDDREGSFAGDGVRGQVADKGVHSIPVRQGFLKVFPSALVPAADDGFHKGA